MSLTMIYLQEVLAVALLSGVPALNRWKNRVSFSVNLSLLSGYVNVLVASGFFRMVLFVFLVGLTMRVVRMVGAD